MILSLRGKREEKSITSLTAMMNDMISDCQKTSCIYKNGVAGAKPPTGTRGGSPSKIAPFRGKRVFGKDAEIRTHQALHEAKSTECPKGDRG